jgi:thymidine kinase
MLSKNPNGKLLKLNTDVLSTILQYVGEKHISQMLHQYTNPLDWKLTPIKKLIYGDIQSGKTEEIVRTLKKTKYNCITKILIVQNSLLILSQYKKRLAENKLSFQIITKNTKKIRNDIVILMNNKKRYAHYLQCLDKPTEYILLMDESDMYVKHALANHAIREYYITATPFIKKYKKYFNSIKTVKNKDNYVGIHNICIQYLDCEDDTANSNYVIHNFLEPNNGGKILLINCFHTLNEMSVFIRNASIEYNTTKFILLTTDKLLYINGIATVITEKSISSIIDFYTNGGNEKIIFVAFRLSSRGLSFTSSDYTTHITHEYTNYKTGQSKRSILQRLRILGVYPNDTKHILYMPLSCELRMNKIIENKDKLINELLI